MEDYMNKKHLGFVGALASAALLGSALTMPVANAAGRTVTVWADETFGPQLTKLIDGNTTIAPGYVIKVKYFSSYDALTSAWDKSTAAGGPDVMTGSASIAGQGGKSGKLVPLSLGSIKGSIPNAGWSAMTFQRRVYGVPLDVDTTAFLWNKDLFGATAPATFQDMVTYYNTNKTAKGLKGGICAFDGTWGAQAVLTALGGGAWATKGSNADYKTVLFNSPAFISNVKSYLVDSTGKSTGFFQWDGCGDAFKAGKIPFAITGAWNFDGIAAAKISFGLAATPGLTATTKGAQWVNYRGAFVTSYASSHGVQSGAIKLVQGYFASAAGQSAMSAVSKRPPANTAAAAKVSDPYTLGVGLAAQTGTPQVGPVLDNKAGGTNWYDTIGAAFTDIFTKGKDVSTTLNAAAVILAKNFADASSNL
jgi:maltose-binding protein MalE